MRPAILCTLLAMATGPATTDATAASPDPKAAAIADQVLEALGGKAAWDATRFLRFDFAVEVDGKPVMTRRHWWNKHDGRYRVEGKTKEGQAYLVLMNVNTKQGQAWLDGKQLAGDDEKKYLEKGYGAWVNDMYWLLMPYKLKDPGVVLGYAGEVKEKDAEWDKLALSFESVGLTPKDRYWAFVNRKTQLVDRWEFILQGQKGPASRFDWTGWQRKGSIMLAAERWNSKEKERIYFPVMDVPATIADTVFTSTTAVP